MTIAVAREIADEFDASLTPTLLKIVAMSRYPLVVVCHDRTGRRWFRRPDNVQGWWFPRKDLDKDSFAHAILFDGAADDTIAHRMEADTWFDFKGADRSDVQEQSIRWGEDKVLTLLTLPDRAIG
ncbi:hypothetical protein [Enterovirga rhinocerotis]|uniref:hypothetical protein n=1 Tax=Enterovirga rhinocerotis TaxID=1339210 RepID=UPI001060734E|nr:hypothetical protein [Enterovirga rhinocerotis]